MFPTYDHPIIIPQNFYQFKRFKHVKMTDERIMLKIYEVRSVKRKAERKKENEFENKQSEEIGQQ